MLAQDKKSSVLLALLLPLAIAITLWTNWENLPSGLARTLLLASGVFLILKYQNHAPLVATVMLFLYLVIPNFIQGELGLSNITIAAGLAVMVGATLWLYRAKGYVALLIPISIILLCIAAIVYLIWSAWSG